MMEDLWTEFIDQRFQAPMVARSKRKPHEFYVVEHRELREPLRRQTMDRKAHIGIWCKLRPPVQCYHLDLVTASRERLRQAGRVESRSCFHRWEPIAEEQYAHNRSLLF